ncbi:MAG: ferrous iron transport protein B [Gammaproteobacteria bacterium]|nr:MAG: ferrous iron transport protein B [Gammaproteobacteria bacterium]
MNDVSEVIALAGNPNAGKTTLFNRLTGTNQHVANYPGVTVEKKSGDYQIDDTKYELVDLPGTYSLTAYSIEEVVARDFIAKEKPHAIVNVVDASNLERNLSFTVQLLEMGVPVCIALNMIDDAHRRGIKIDHKLLSEKLGVCVTPIIAKKGQGVDELIGCARESLDKVRKPLEISYGNDIEEAIYKMSSIIEEKKFLTDLYASRWIAIKYLEQDELIIEAGDNANQNISTALKKVVDEVTAHIEGTLNTYPEAIIADQRYGYIRALLKQGVMTRDMDETRVFLTERIDAVLLNRFFGPIIMIAIITALYYATFTFSETPVGWLESAVGWLSAAAESVIPEGLLQSLLVSGVIDGVGGVLGFTPIIMFMFLGIAVLEDSGYLARMSFMLDRLFRLFGLHGNSVMPFIVSGGIAGGCAVPGVMAARTIKSPRERLVTILTAPFMNCGAKLPVFALLVAAFFEENEATVMVIITIVSWVGALFAAKLLRLTVLKGDESPFVMELPPYRLPTIRGVLLHTWEKVWQYIKKAGTVILAISILIWAMMTFPGLDENRTQAFESQRQVIAAAYDASITTELENADEDTELSKAATELQKKMYEIDGLEAETALRHSIAGRIGTAMESVTSVTGFDWRTNIALVSGFAAKEVIVSTLGTAYSLGEVDPEDTSSLSEKLANSPSWSKATAWALIIFTIFYAPCFVTVVCIAREAGSWKWGAFSVVFNTTIAFILSAVVYQLTIL